MCDKSVQKANKQVGCWIWRTASHLVSILQAKMSSRTSRKAAHPRAKAPEPIITRNKSAQQKRQLRKKELKKTEKPELTKPETKSPKQPETKSTKQPETKSTKEPEIKLTKIDLKSPKISKIVKRSQVSLLKPVEVSDEVLEQIEYYPNTLKRDIRAKKIMLKPKHNFKVVAATNKRKLATPQKGSKSPSSNPLSPIASGKPTRPCSPELSMQDMVRMMDETRSLSDEDFMEILTCPSPVWWEDPPDGGFDEGSIHTRMPEPPPKKITNNKKRKISTNKTTKSQKKNIIIDLVDDIETPKRKIDNTDERFVKKKQKLENILGNIKKKVNEPKKNNTRRNISESEGDISDLSFNEEEILKNLENMDIPIAEPPIESILIPKTEIEDIQIKKELIDTHENEIIAPKNELVREAPSTDLKPVIKEVFSIKSSVFDSNEFKSEVCAEEISLENKSDDVVVLDSTNSSLGNNEDKSFILDLLENTSNCETGKISPIIDDTKNTNKLKNEVSNKKTKVLSEYINVYKITSENIKNEDSDIDSKSTEDKAISKLESVLKLNDFFRHCKNNKRLQKFKTTIPANSVTDVKEKTIECKKENSDETIDLKEENNRLKDHECHVQKIENGTKECFHEKCDISPVFLCGLCNFKTDTKEVFMQHVSSCKDVARINWSHSFVLNQI